MRQWNQNQLANNSAVSIRLIIVFLAHFLSFIVINGPDVVSGKTLISCASIYTVALKSIISIHLRVDYSFAAIFLQNMPVKLGFQSWQTTSTVSADLLLE